MKRLEDALQRQVCQYLTLLENRGRLIYFAVPNGGYRKRIEASIMKGLGVRAGVPDICIVLPDGKARFMELKIGKNKPTKPQEEWAERLNNSNALTVTIYSFDEATEALRAWGVIGKKGIAA